MKKTNNFKSILKVSLVLACIVALIGVPFANSASAEYEPTKAPKIVAFKVDKANINKGDSVVLSWEVVNAKTVKIDGLRTSEGLELKDSMEVWPEESTTYVLTAYGDGGQASKSVAVNVGVSGAVKIDSFNVSKTEIFKGDSVEISWKTTNAKKIVLIGIRGDEDSEVPGVGTNEIWPEVTTTYVLRAYGINGEMDSKSVTVNVKPPVKPAVINSFAASSEKVEQGQKVTLSWDVANAKSIEIKNVKTGLSAKGTIDVTPNADTVYSLVVVGNDNKTLTKDVKVTVTPKTKAPVINTFTASSVTIDSGELVSLKWTTTNVEKCELLTSDGGKISNRPANGGISVTPFETKTYTLVAYGVDGKTKVEKSIKITVE